jgi:D-tyrosyl-tRNA(Tyr) deacylase
MRIVVQRVKKASVEVDNKPVAQIDKGLLVYLSVAADDKVTDADFISDKLSNLRIFADQAGKMNLGVQDVGGSILLVSNFTLHGDCRKGRRPGLDAAAGPKLAEELYDKVAEKLQAEGITVRKGSFGSLMQISSINDGPVTFLLDSSRLF